MLVDDSQFAIFVADEYLGHAGILEMFFTLAMSNGSRLGDLFGVEAHEIGGNCATWSQNFHFNATDFNPHLGVAGKILSPAP